MSKLFRIWTPHMNIFKKEFYIWISFSNFWSKIFYIIFIIWDTNVTNIMIQIKILNSTRQAPYISNLDVWYHDGFWHQQASPATWWRIWASILIFWATHFQRWLRLRTIFLAKGQPSSQPSHHLSTPTSNLSA